MSSYLWRYYLENDAQRFRRLLQGPQSSHASTHRGEGSKPAVTTPTNSFKSPSAGIYAKQRPGSPPNNVVITKQMLRELDVMGRSILHLACSAPDRLPFATALLSHPLIDPGHVDLESGWTSLHRALYHGNVSAAREILAANPANWSLVRTKDHAGDTPFEVFEASVQELEDTRVNSQSAVVGEEPDEEGGPDEITASEKLSEGKGDEVFAWGSNKNLTLGFPDGDDRSYPERVQLQRPRHILLEIAKRECSRDPLDQGKSAEEMLNAPVLFSVMHILDVHLSKLHTAILTTDPHSNLYMCGFGRGGRLGLGGENTQFSFRPLSPPLLPKKRVERIALGLDHTVVVLEGGEVWTWGSNQYGQLGYALPQRVLQEEPIQPAPRQVFGLLRKEPVVGCAASRTHTAVFTGDSVYTFGKNDGQLGILDSSDARTLAMQSTPRKVSANFLNGTNVKDVVAIDKATAILLERNEIWVLAGYGYSKLSFPMERFVGLPAGAKNITRYETGSNLIRKIAGGGDTLCALSQMGDVFTIDVDSTLKERASRGIKGPWTPQRAWSLRKRHMAVRDVDVGVDGNIIICTQSGGVWRRNKRAKLKEGSGEGSRFKFDRVPGLTRITAVRSNTTEAFAAIRRDANILRTDITVEPQGIWKAVSEMLSFGRLFEEGDGAEDPPSISGDEEWGYGPNPRPRGYGRAMEYFVLRNIEEMLRSHLASPERQGGLDNWDMFISTSKCAELDIPVHSAILGRSPTLRKLIARGSGAFHDIVAIESSPLEKPKVVIKGVDLLTLLNLVYYLYIDTVLDLWHQRGINKTQATFFKSLRSELANLASALELKPLAEAVGRMHYPDRALHTDLQLAYKDPDFFQTADMVIDLADDEWMVVHSALMRVRCPFFDALYGGKAGGRWLLGRQKEEGIRVDMKHVPKDVMEMVVSWLYYDWDTEGFDGVRVGVDEGDVDKFLDFVLDVLATANELMLDRLSQVCQKVVGRYVNTRNAAGLLTAVAPCSEKGFKEACLQYMCMNLETMLENHLLDELDGDLMADLDEVVRENQRRCSPRSRSGKQEERLLEKYPAMKEDSKGEATALLAQHVAMSEEPVLSSSLKGYAGFSQSPLGSHIPGSAKGKRKASKVSAHASPVVKAAPGHDDIFAMDDDELLSPTYSSEGDAAPPRPRGAKGSSPVMTHQSPLERGSPEERFVALTPPPPSQAPWCASTALKDSKLDMKEIMAQASATASGKSALTAQLSTLSTPKTAPLRLESPATPTKRSQKERKRQQQQTISNPTGSPSTAERKPAWNVNVTTQAPVVSLKEVLSSGPAKAPSQKQGIPPPRPIPVQRPSPSYVGPSPVSKHNTTATKAPPNTAASYTVNPFPSRPPLSAPGSSSIASTPHRAVSSPRFLPGPAVRLSLQDIISQEEAHKEMVKEYTSKKSLQEIQEEQEFLRWWEEESRRVQFEEAQQKKEKPHQKGGARGGRGGRGGGNRGGRGRGRGRGRGGRGGVENNGSATGGNVRSGDEAGGRQRIVGAMV